MRAYPVAVEAAGCPADADCSAVADCSADAGGAPDAVRVETCPVSVERKMVVLRGVTSTQPAKPAGPG